MEAKIPFLTKSAQTAKLKFRFWPWESILEAKTFSFGPKRTFMEANCRDLEKTGLFGQKSCPADQKSFFQEADDGLVVKRGGSWKQNAMKWPKSDF